MRKLSKKLLLSILSVALVFIALGTTTFAWFSMNNTVTVKGMEVTTNVGSNLLIAGDTLDSTAKKAENLFRTGIDGAIEAQLEPVSTTTGKAFFFTTSALANGDADGETYTAYNAEEVPTTAELATFNSAYGTTDAVGYVDYVFQLKAVNTSSSAKPIKITELALVYAGAKDAGKAYRVAVFCEDMGEAGTSIHAGSGTLKGVYSVSDAANQTANTTVDSTTTVAGSLTCNNATKLVDVPAGKTNYYKVVVRLYLEGEDKTCTNDTYLSLTSEWALNLALSLDTEATTNTAVSALTKWTTYEVSSTKYYYDGTNVYTGNANVNTGTLVASASIPADVKTAFGIE